MAPNVLKSYLLLFIHKLLLFALPTNAVIIFIHVFIEISVFIGIYCGFSFFEVDCIYLTCISTVFIAHICIYFYIYLFIFIGLDIIFFYSIHVL